MRCIKYSQNIPNGCGNQILGFSPAFAAEETWQRVSLSKQMLVRIYLILLSGPWILLLSEVSGSDIPGGAFCCFKTFLGLYFSFHLWLNDSLTLQGTVNVFIWGSAMTQHYGFYPEAGGSLDVSCRYLIATYNTQRAAVQIRGHRRSCRSVDERIWLLWKQVKAPIDTTYGSWVLAGCWGILSARNISCNVKWLLSDLLLCFQKGKIIFWKMFTITVLLDRFSQPQEMNEGLSCLIY